MAPVLLRLYIRDGRALGCQCPLIGEGVISSSRNGKKAPNSSSKAYYSDLPTAFSWVTVHKKMVLKCSIWSSGTSVFTDGTGAHCWWRHFQVNLQTSHLFNLIIISWQADRQLESFIRIICLRVVKLKWKGQIKGSSVWLQYQGHTVQDKTKEIPLSDCS